MLEVWNKECVEIKLGNHHKIIKMLKLLLQICWTLIVEAIIQLVLTMGTVGFQFMIFIFHLHLANSQSYECMQSLQFDCLSSAIHDFIILNYCFQTNKNNFLRQYLVNYTFRNQCYVPSNL